MALNLTVRLKIAYTVAVKHYIYIVECKDKTLYTGYTTDVKRRIKEHNSEEGVNGSTGAKYTRSRRPVKLRYVEELPDKSTAMTREYRVKQLTREQKKELIKGMSKVELKDFGVK